MLANRQWFQGKKTHNTDCSWWRTSFSFRSEISLLENRRQKIAHWACPCLPNINIIIHADLIILCSKCLPYLDARELAFQLCLLVEIFFIPGWEYFVYRNWVLAHRDLLLSPTFSSHCAEKQWGGQIHLIFQWCL